VHETYWIMGILAISFLSMSRWLACCINAQPGGPGDFWSRFSSSSPWYASIRLPESSASFGPPRVFYFPGTRHIWWAFPYPPPGETPAGRPATPHQTTSMLWTRPKNGRGKIAKRSYEMASTGKKKTR
jgi:hypothetical protein